MAGKVDLYELMESRGIGKEIITRMRDEKVS